MIKFNYISSRYSKRVEYTLTQYQKGESFFIYDNDNLIGSIMYVAKEWVQVSGKEMLQGKVNELGFFINKSIESDTR